MIVRAVGGFYYVDTGGEIFACRARGKFRRTGETPLVGDFVDMQKTAPGEGCVVAIHPRSNFLVRPAVANVKRLCIVCSAAPPVTDLFLIDKVSAIAECKGIEPVIVLNKCDIAPGFELGAVYVGAGFPVIRTRAFTGEGVSDLKEALGG